MPERETVKPETVSLQEGSKLCASSAKPRPGTLGQPPEVHVEPAACLPTLQLAGNGFGNIGILAQVAHLLPALDAKLKSIVALSTALLDSHSAMPGQCCTFGRR